MINPKLIHNKDAKLIYQKLEALYEL